MAIHKEKGTLTELDPTFWYKKVFLGKMSDGDYVTIEEFIDGVFVKYINNIGEFALRVKSCVIRLSVLHISHMKSHRESSQY